MAEILKRGPGRPKGCPKTGGRQKGTPNRRTVQTRDRIQELADPIAFLADVMAGKRMVAAGEPGDATKTWVFPTLTQRITASETLLRKLLPDLRSVENTGNLQPAFTAIEYRIVDPRGEAAAAIRAEVNRRAGNGVAESDASAEPEPAETCVPYFGREIEMTEVDAGEALNQRIDAAELSAT